MNNSRTTLLIDRKAYEVSRPKRTPQGKRRRPRKHGGEEKTTRGSHCMDCHEQQLKDYALNRPESLWGAETGKNRTPQEKAGEKGWEILFFLEISQRKHLYHSICLYTTVLHLSSLLSIFVVSIMLISVKLLYLFLSIFLCAPPSSEPIYEPPRPRSGLH